MKRLDSIAGTLAMLVILVFVGMVTFHVPDFVIPVTWIPAAVEAQVSAVDPCNSGYRQVYVVNITANQQIVTGVAAKNVFVCMVQIEANSAADNIALVEGTGTTCGTGTVGMAGGATAATGWNLQQYGTVVVGAHGYWTHKTATAGDNVCFLVSGVAQVSGIIQFVVI